MAQSGHHHRAEPCPLSGVKRTCQVSGAIRDLHPDVPMYSHWSYGRNRWSRDAGLRIDHLLLSKEAAWRLVAASVDRSVRGVDNASDHAPVWIELKDVNRSSPRKRGSQSRKASQAQRF
jgi:endonuclease/exonuclease/phosphatase family metal-dependent hydrolase